MTGDATGMPAPGDHARGPGADPDLASDDTSIVSVDGEAVGTVTA